MRRDQNDTTPHTVKPVSPQEIIEDLKFDVARKDRWILNLRQEIKDLREALDKSLKFDL